MDNSSLRNKTCLVTGASRGIGKAIALQLARDGCIIAAGYTRCAEAAIETARECGNNAIAVHGDVSSPADCKNIVQLVTDQLGRIDIVVNNAAIGPRDSFEMPYEEWVSHWAEVMNVNLMGAVNIAYWAVEKMKKTGGGKIINVSSRSAFRGETEYLAYAASKAAMVNFTRCLARALASENIRAYAVAPGFIQAGMGMEEIEQRGDEIRAQIPSGIIGTAQDVANVVSFLASDLANYMTGSTIDVNGGSYLH